MAKSKTLGAWGEEKAAGFLQQQGYRLVQKNFHSRYGEIDLVVENDEFLIFVEVKLRSDGSHGRPEEFVDHRKQEKLRATAECYLQKYPTEKQPRFDVVAIYAPEGMDTHPIPVRHIQNAF